MTEYIGSYVVRKGIRGSVYQFVGTYVKFKNGGCRFSGKIRKVVI